MIFVKDEEIIDKILVLIDKLKPFLMNDGGNLEFVKYENNIVYVRMLGACNDFDMMDITFKEVINVE